jgi:hypothetical protein
MPTPNCTPDPERVLDENAASSQVVITKDGSVTSHSLPDQIQWANRAAAIAAARRGGTGIRIHQVRGSDPVHG